MSESDDSTSSARANILSMMDGFIEQIQKLRKVMLGMSLSAIVLAPLAIALSTYLLIHPSFFAILEIENDFGLVLSILLGAVILISGIWLITGIRQYRSISSWQVHYDEFTREKEEMDRKIARRFGLE